MAVRFYRITLVFFALAMLSGCLFPRPQTQVPTPDFGALLASDVPESVEPAEGEADGEAPPVELPEFPELLEIFEGDEVQFFDLSKRGSAPITVWSWNFGDGLTSDEQNPLHTFDRVGIFDVRLYVANRYGAADVVRKAFVTVSPRKAPKAKFSAGPLRGLDPLTVTFIDESEPGSDPIDSWFWRFGDGRTSTARNPVHEYLREGLFSASLTVYTLAGQDTFTRPDYIAVVPPINADFEASPESGPAPLDVQFTDLSDTGRGEDPEWSWDFGDGSTSIAQSPRHRYVNPGRYTVRMTLKTTRDQDSVVKEQLIEVQDNGVPCAEFSATPTSGAIPLTVKFTDRSVRGSRPITGWLWDFGDESTSEEQNPFHVYTTPGTYTVSLTASSDAGANTMVKEEFIVAEGPLTATFTAEPVEGFAPLTVAFEDTTESTLRPILTRRWDFGDGGTSAVEKPSHTYTVPGEYDVSLTVTTATETATVSKRGLIEVSDTTPPLADFSATPLEGRPPLNVDFTNETDPGDGADPVYSWEFGDGGTSEMENPAYTYERLGTYSVKLTAETSLGEGSETKVDYIKVRTADLTFGGDDIDEARGLALDASGRFLMAGSTRNPDGDLDVLLVVAGPDGNPIQERTYGFEFDENAVSLTQNPDGTLALAGTRTTPERGDDILVMKLDSNGSAIWSRTYGGLGRDGASSIRSLPDGGYIVAGLSVQQDEDIPDALLMRLDADGNLLWQVARGGDGFEEFNDAIPLREGGLAAVGTAVSPDESNTRMFLLVTDGLGNPVYERVLAANRDQRGRRIFETATGDFAVFGNSVSQNGAGLNILGALFPLSGSAPTLVYESIGNLRDSLRDLIVLPDGGVMLAGSTTNAAGASNALLIRLTAGFSEIDGATYGGAQADTFEAVAAILSDEGDMTGFAAAGSTDSFNSQARDVYLIKTDELLNPQVFPE
jgi:PKD repeat protein